MCKDCFKNADNNIDDAIKAYCLQCQGFGKGREAELEAKVEEAKASEAEEAKALEAEEAKALEAESIAIKASVGCEKVSCPLYFASEFGKQRSVDMKMLRCNAARDAKALKKLQGLEAEIKIYRKRIYQLNSWHRSVPDMPRAKRVVQLLKFYDNQEAQSAQACIDMHCAQCMGTLGSANMHICNQPCPLSKWQFPYLEDKHRAYPRLLEQILARVDFNPTKGETLGKVEIVVKLSVNEQIKKEKDKKAKIRARRKREREEKEKKKMELVASLLAKAKDQVNPVQLAAIASSLTGSKKRETLKEKGRAIRRKK